MREEFAQEGRQGAGLLRRLQSGYLRRYALGIAVSSVVLLGFIATRVLAG